MKGELAEALAALDESLRLRPGFVEAHSNRGTVLAALGRHDEALAAQGEALRLKPDHGRAHYNRGSTLTQLGRLEEALVAFDQAVRHQPDLVEAHQNRGLLLRLQGRFPEAAAAIREATRFKPDYAEAHCELGRTLQAIGQLPAALAALKRGDELGSKKPGWRLPSKQWVHDCERLTELDKKLPALLSGEVKPADADEAIRWAELCHIRGRYEAELHLYEGVFTADPKRAEDLAAGHRYHAACAAALIACGRGQDDPPPDEPARARRRRQALDWLRADLVLLTRHAGTPPARAAVQQRLFHWRHDPDLAGLRDEAELAKLPDEEREAWHRLWADVAALAQQTPRKE
jgi:tetratricopeptide (TPR) repeat protein